MKRQATTGGRKNRKRPGNLREQVDPLMCQAYTEARMEANGLWPTPQARDYRSGDNPESIRQERKKEQGWSHNLNDVVKLWPTPAAQDGKNSTLPPSQLNRDTVPGAVMRMWPTPKANSYTGASNHGEGGLDIQTAVKIWPTPRGGEKGVGLCGGTGHLQILHEGLDDKELVRKISSGNGGQLNADWVEQLMGFPKGWTNLECENPDNWQGWPAGTGTEQFDHEPPRVVEGQKDRAKRLKALGNAVVPAQILPIFEAIAAVENKTEGFEAIGELG